MALRFFRNFAIFFALLLTCAGGVGYVIVQGQNEVNTSNEWILHTHKIIITSEELSTLIEGILASQRGYLLTRDQEHWDNYEQKKIYVQQNLEKLHALVKDNPSQTLRVEQMHEKFTSYIQLLEKRVKYLTGITPPGQVLNLSGTSNVRALREEVLRINNRILREEHELMGQRLKKLQYNKQTYFTTLVLSGSISLALLLILNSFLLRAQSKRTEAEKNLEITQERLNLAVRGARDGIFDWDLETNEVFWSAEYKAMLGYADDELPASIENFNRLLHPDDSADLWEAYELYTKGSTSEFDHVFRMQHKSGRWVWISARGKAVFDKQGKPTRFLGAHSDITHFKESEARLAEAKQRAEKANRAKTEFLAHMSHEIRTPLTAISGISEILQRQISTLSDRQQQLVRTLYSSTSVLRDLISDILDFSKIESGEIELKEEEVPLSEIFSQIISMMTVPAHQKGLQFNVDYSAVKDDMIICDQIRLRQILINLVNNAIKFSEKGSVTVQATKAIAPQGEVLRIDVIDTGIGIAESDYEKVFERFKQIDSTASRKYGGTGLGLPISLNLARMMNGDILLSSTPGIGSTFTLLLPLRLVSAVDDAMTTEDRGKQLTDIIRTRIEGKRKLLLVEDYEGNIVVLTYILEEIGCGYDLAKTGREAVELWQKNHYDLILMDIQMPEMDGFEATSRIRRMERERQRDYTPIIGMTAHALVGDRDKCIAAGMDSYLPKPIIENDLKNELIKYLNLNTK